MGNWKIVNGFLKFLSSGISYLHNNLQALFPKADKAPEAYFQLSPPVLRKKSDNFRFSNAISYLVTFQKLWNNRNKRVASNLYEHILSSYCIDINGYNFF